MMTYRTQLAAARNSRRRRRPAVTGLRKGFTLIEAAIVTAIVGIGIVGLLELIAAGSMANRQAAELTMAINLAANVTEMMQGKDYDTLMATYDNKTYTIVKDGRGNDLKDAGNNPLFPNWKQVVDLEYVQPGLLTSPAPDPKVTMRVTAKIYHHDLLVYTSRWIVARPS
jgi:type II secretory pathway pseudopilin PulG